LNLTKKELGDEKKTIAKALGVVGVGVLGLKTLLMVDGQSAQITARALPEGFGTVDAIAEVLFHNYLISFELTGLLLLVAVIGAVILAKRSL
ncbi:MAG TPA: NADH-quinone oxidoreductase subunit J, partial [Myxococcota bacterium]|nr:NADH-quinone oxidoreductase subunit J [Myxococcota bacterium]